MDLKDRPVALQLSGVKKQYRLGQIGAGTLQADLQSWWARRRGREDPNSKIGTNTNLHGKTFLALDGIDLTVFRGEALGIIGPNGAGKSTILKLISRVTAPTEGDIDLYGRVSSMLEVGTGLDRNLTGRENIYLNGAILGMTRREIDRKLDKIIAFSELEPFIDTPVKRYSSGMYVKLAFAVAAHLDNEIMIMDEVLAVGDAAFQNKCLTRMREAARQEGRTVLYVSHNMNTIRALCDRCVVMERGRIRFDGAVEPAIADYLSMSAGYDAVDLDLSKMVHAGLETGRVLRMEHLLLESKVEPVYTAEETMKLRFHLQLEKTMEQVLLRFTVRTLSDQAVGTAWSQPMPFPVSGEAEADFSLPLSALAPGKYYASLGFYRREPGGSLDRLDHISRAFRFEITTNADALMEGENAVGAVVLPEMRGIIL